MLTLIPIKMKYKLFYFIIKEKDRSELKKEILIEKVMIPTISLEDKIKEINKPWSPIEIARVNDQVVRMALCYGEYHWHKHKNEDELFYVYRGSIVIQVKNHADITLHEGEMAVIPKGVEHCPKSLEPSYVLTFEPYVLKSRGD